jgi:hypothetical protein
MKLQMKIAMVLGALVLAIAPVSAIAGQGNGPKYTPAPETPPTPGPGAGLPEKAKAYGVYCQDQSKKHVAGEKGTRSAIASPQWPKRLPTTTSPPAKPAKG